MTKPAIITFLFFCACSNDTFVSGDAGDAQASDVIQSGDQTSGCPNGQILCGGHCTDTSSDANNCGSCNVVCSTDAGVAACVNSTCLYPMGDTACVTVNSTDVFWTNGRAAAAGGGVFRMPRGKNAKPTRVADAQNFPHGIAADDKQVFWTTSGDTLTNGAVRRAKPDGTNLVDIAATSLTGAKEPGPVALANGQVFWGNTLSPSIWQGTTDGSAAPMLITFTSGTPAFLTSTSLSLYWTANLTSGTGTGSVGRYTFSNQSPNDILTQPNDTFGAIWVQANDNNVCLARFGTKQVMCGTWASTGPTNKVADSAAWSLTATGDGSFLYWAERVQGGNIDRFTVNTSNQSILASDDTPSCVAIDDTNLYWAARGRLMPGVIAR